MRDEHAKNMKCNIIIKYEILL